MCGIAGFVNFDFSHPYFETIHQTQFHRGPDFQSDLVYQNFRLYHQRLSIIDTTSEANQPFQKHDLALVFNGEIYNYKQLRSLLISSYGVEFFTSSDTEVLLEVMRIFGPKGLAKVRGMYSFALLNKTNKELLIVRDPFGIKPLFYFFDGLKLAFASELKTLIKAPDFSKELNPLSLVSATDLLWVPGTESIFKNVKKLPPGSYGLYNSKTGFTVKKHYTHDYQQREITEAETIDRLDEVLSDSITKHLEADVPVSAFLSGGLDSSLISVIAHKHQPLSTYSIAFSKKDKTVEQMPDDAKYAKILAEKFGFQHNEIVITPDIVNELPKMVYHLDEPLGDPAAINTYLISKAAKQNGVKVLLSGMGADEIFFGYRRQKATLIAEKYKLLPPPIRQLLRSSANVLPVRFGNNGLKPVRWAQRFLSFADLPTPDARRT